MIHRAITSLVQSSMFSGDVLIFIWPRQVGKTTLIQMLLEDIPKEEILSFNGDFLADRRDIQIQSERDIEAIFGKFKYIVIDEAQKIENIGNILKVLVDLYKSEKQILVTGSSTLHLIDETAEPLTGRKKVFHLYPIAFSELVTTSGLRDARLRLEETLLYGMYPQVLGFSDVEKKKEKLQDIVSGQLYRDILEFQEVKNPHILTRLLELLAIQIGSEVSYNALAWMLGVSQQTVERYIDLLEKSFVIFQLRPYATNKQKEVTKMKKVYFTDLGIRNAILQAFQPVNLRTDIGALWENYVILERRKNIEYQRLWTRQYFWRTKAQEEIDLLEMRENVMNVFECKWSEQRYRPSTAFTTAYPDAIVELIHRDNYYQYMI